MALPNPILKGQAITAEWLNSLLAECKANRILPSAGFQISRLPTGTTIAKEDAKPSSGGGKLKIVKVTGYDSATQLYTGKVQEKSGSVPYEFADTTQEITFYDFQSVALALNNATQLITGEIVPVISTAAGSFAISSDWVFPVRCYPDGGTEGSGAGAGTNDSVTWTAYLLADIDKDSPLGTGLVQKRPKVPGCEYKRPTSYETAGAIGTAYFTWTDGSPTVNLLEIVEERPKLALRLDSDTNQLILEGGETTTGGTRAVGFNRTQETACPS